MLLLPEDYDYLNTCGLAYAEDEKQRYLVLRDYPLPEGLYSFGGKPLRSVNVLVRIPGNYPTFGTDMLWVFPCLGRTDGKVIPNTNPPNGGDNSSFEGNVYCRWSRHYAEGAWKAGVDGIEKIVSRIEWALRNPDANVPRQ
jgi:hypothetical protein